MKNGQHDGFITLPTPERATYTAASKISVATATMGLFTYTNHPRMSEMTKIRNISDLKGYKLITYLGHGWAKKHLSECNVEYSGTDLKSVLYMLASKRGDLTVEPIEVVLYNIRKLGLKDEVISIPNVKLRALEFKLLVGLKSKYRHILPALDRTLIDMKNDGSMEKIYKKYR